MGGRIGVESAPDAGSTFWVELALTESFLEREERAGTRIDSIQPATASSRTVLYIEDNVVSAQLIERIFSRWSHVRLISAMQGRLGLELAHQHRPDLILLDLHLPDIQGHDVLQRLRADPATSHIPVVITSADATPGQIARLKEAGADEYLTKPLDIARFAEVVRQRLE
jgi:CheY-like chemotaxis protein